MHRHNRLYTLRSNFSARDLRNTGVILSVAAASLALAGCGEAPVATEGPRPVKVMVVQPPVTERTLTYSGTLAPRIESTLGFRVSGKMIERYVNAGNTIKSGQPIARLDENDLKIAENSARANVVAAKTRLAVAKDANDRANFLLPNDYIAKSTADQRKLEFDSAKANYDAVQDQLKQAINSTSYALLSADKDGIITSVRAEPGQVVSAGQAIVTFALSGDIEAAIAVPEQEIAQLKVGDPAVVSLWSAESVRATGKIREIAGSADPASRTYAVRISEDAPHPQMRLGMTAAVTLRLPVDTPATIIPLAALADASAGNSLVFVVDPLTATVSARKVVVAGITDAGARVASGLNPGEIVVVGGTQFLRDGMKVRLPQEALPAIAQSSR